MMTPGLKREWRWLDHDTRRTAAIRARKPSLRSTFAFGAWRRSNARRGVDVRPASCLAIDQAMRAVQDIGPGRHAAFRAISTALSTA